MKLLKNHLLPLSAPLGGIVVMILRFIYLSTADERGLLASGHIAGILTDILILLVPALLLWWRLVLPKERTCHFPASVIATVGYGIGALGVAATAISLLLHRQDNMDLVAAIVGFVAAASLGLLAVYRYFGKKSNVLLHTAVCLFFVLLLICQYRHWSSEPQLALYACPLLATVCLMLSAYHRVCFDVAMGQLRAFCFYRSLSIFFCLAAIPGSSFWILYLAGTVWSAADLLNLATQEVE